MNIKTRNTSLLALGLALLVLTGCEANTTEAVREVVNETIGDAMKQINEQIDGLQEDADKALGKPEEEKTETEQATEESDLPESARTHEA